MKVLFALALTCALLWTGCVVFANMMRPPSSGSFVGGNTIAVVWLLVAICGAMVYWG